MADVVKKELDLKEEEVEFKLLEIRSMFKKIGQSSGKKIKKYIPQRLKEVSKTFFFFFLKSMYH